MTRLLLADAAWFIAAALIALGMGMVGDRFFRHPPLGWHYQTAAQRVLAMPGSQAPINMVSVEEVSALVSRPDVITLDARPRIFYELGHLPGARSLSREQFDVDFAIIEKELRVPGHTLLVYCSDASCEDSAIVAHELQKRGLGPLILFPGGLEEWEAAGHPVETVP
ncbi:MAG: rhodanese y domain superfamily protein [Chthoniobacteraceae bacterium]|nr:rhodanese y domain superfamily protein [Chthoniobacteraceae bacterium]